MQVNELLLEGYGRLPELVHGAVDGLTAEQLHWAPAPGANSVGWLVWHLIRVQDDHIAELIDGAEQVWATGGHASRFGLKPDPGNTGYGHTAAEVAAVRPDGPDALIAYFDAVYERTRDWLATLTADDLDRIVDERWDPPVTLGVRLVSVLDDDTQHVGQAAYARGLLPD
ncbi:DinB family protein [Dactylosporangium fulvum]|uniref:DinB family protein n=1 Tax=Dactylosporangium fulvum TaxID=53359 RepID=A0ABY5WE84_9ACTN|nr:DinB family protein [Dactylosporangium fulvum]UWP87738.1 DinB family protein [Dactylosporangium fulvum]